MEEPESLEFCPLTEWERGGMKGGGLLEEVDEEAGGCDGEVTVMATGEGGGGERGIS